MSIAMRTSLCLILVAAAARADPVQGRKLNAQGMGKVAHQDWSGALELFRKAIAADPDNVLAHYNAASMESRLGRIDDAATDLAWLAASSDRAAAKALAHGKTDPDLDRASLDARVRTAIGAPALATMTADAIVVERSGRWGEDGSACAQPGLTLTFKHGGVLTVRSQWGCDATDVDTTETGTWKAKGPGVVLTTKKLFPGGAVATIGPCDQEPSAGSCLLVTDGADGNDHAFHRGPAEGW